MPSFDIAILTATDELLGGQTSDGLTAAVVAVLTRHGYRPRCSLAVSDNEKEIFAALNYLVAQSRFVIVSGGIGASSDDLTARAAARALEQPLVIHDEALAMVRTWFASRNQPFEPGSERQALLPQAARLIPNPTGVTPGFSLTQGDCQLFFLPGVVADMQAMFETSVLPQLQQDYPDSLRLHQRTFKLFGLPESRIIRMIPQAQIPEGVRISFSHDDPLVLLRLRTSGADADSRLDQAEAALLQTLGDHVMARDGQTAEGNVGKLLTRAGLTLALAESCTGGLLSSLLTRNPGASAFLDRAGVTYADAAKQQWLKVPLTILQQHGAVSEPCARAMAIGLRQQCGTDLALAITGVAGPDGGTPDKPVGTVYLALASAAGVHAKRYSFSGDRARIQRMSAFMALEWLRRFALQQQEAAAESAGQFPPGAVANPVKE
ncbi:MAG: CinA family nicotinamide mononucleotide deamidase-related protein [Pelovirga sp.]